MANPTAHGGSATWNGGAGPWSTAGNWTSTPSGNFPNNGNATQNWDATVGAGDATLSQPITIQNFTLTGGIVDGASSLTTNGLFNWTGGTLGGSGVLNANGGITLDATSAYLYLNTRTLNNAAGKTATYLGGGASLYFTNGGTFNNAGTFAAQNDQGFLSSTGGGVFNNTGTFSRTTSANTFSIGSGIYFNNSGTVNVQTGTLNLAGRGTNTGAFNVSAGATLSLNGLNKFAAGSTIGGAGAVNIFGGVTTLNGTYNVAGTTTISAGTVNGASNLTVAGPLAWLGGTMGGTGVTAANGGTTLDNQLFLDTRTFNNPAGKTAGFASTSGYLYFRNGATFNNAGTFNATNDNALYDNGGGGVFNNTGVFNRSTTTGTFIVGSNVPFNNTGVVNVQTGTLALRGGTSSGAFALSTGTTLLFDSGSYTLSGAANPFSGAGTLAVAGATLVLNGPATVAGITALSAGTINGPATLTTNGPLNWTGGTLAGNGVTNANGGITIDGQVFLDTRTLNHAAGQTATFASTNGYLYFRNGAAFNNAGTFVANNDNALYDNGGGGTFNNTGTFTRNTGTGTFTVGGNVAFNNPGTTGVQTGVLDIAGGGASTGAFDVSSGATLQFDSNYALNGASNSVTGAGTLRVNSGVLTLNGATTVAGSTALNGGSIAGPGTLTTNGAFNWTGGTLAGTGAVTANAGINLDVTSASLFLDTRTLNNPAGKTATLTGTGAYLYLRNGGVLNNAGSFAVTNDLGIYDNGGGGTINNSGTFTRNTTAGTFTIGGNVAFNNTGAVNVQTGVLDLIGGGTSTGSFVVSNGATLRFDSNYTLAAATNNVTGAGTVSVNSVILTLKGATNVAGSFALGGSGLVTGPGALTIAGPFTWTGGTLGGTGATNANGGITIDSASYLNARTLTNAAGKTATFASPGAYLYFQNGGTFNNPGTFVANNDGYLYDDGASGTFNNSGTFTRNTTTGVFRIYDPLEFNNTGTVNAQTGTLEFAGDITQRTGSVLSGGKWVVSAGATLTFSSGVGVLTNGGDVTLSGPGSVFAAIDSLATNNGAFRLLASRSFTAAAGFTNGPAGTLQLGGGVFSAASLANSGQVFGFGTLAIRPVNAGAVRANGGTLVLNDGVQGGGTVQIDAGATLNLSAGTASSIGSLVHNGTTPGSLNLGTKNLTVSNDYANASFGTGNSFAPRANVAGTGLILAGGTAGQTIIGSAVTGGTTASPTLNFGSVHAGSTTTKTFAINNSGSGGAPFLRGALQTTVNGGHITDARLTGSGIAAANFAPIAAGGNSTSYGVNFLGVSVGPLTGQTVHVVNNFDNVIDPTLTITGTVYRYAAASAHTPEPVAFGNVHVGAAPSQLLTVKNTAGTDGYSEKLDAAFGAVTGGVTTAGAFTLLAAGSTDSTSLSVGINTSTAGVKNGTATLTLTSDGTGTSGLANTALTPQTVNVTGSVFRLAAASAHTPEPVAFGNVHVGAPLSRALSLTNTAANDGFSEKLDAAFTGTTGSLTAAGSFTLLAPGATNTTSLVVSLPSTSVGPRSGTAVIGLTSDGTGTSGLANTALAFQTVNASATVYRLAVASAHTPEPVAFGNVHVGAAASQLLSLTNTATNDGYSERLDASLSGATGGVTTAGSFTLLAPGGTNSSSLAVGISTSTAGVKNGTATLALTSDGTGTSGLANTSLAAQTVAVTGSVYRLAAPTAHTPEPVSFGIVHLGETPTRSVSVTNGAANDGFSERLNGAIGTATGSATAAGSFTALVPQAASTALSVGLNTSTAGTKTGTAAISLASSGAGTSGLADTALAGQTVNVQGQVNYFSDPIVIFKSGPAALLKIDGTHYTLDFGSVNANSGVYSDTIGLQNLLHSTFQDLLTGGFTTSGVTHFTLSAFPASYSLTAGSELDPGIAFDSAQPTGSYADALFINPKSSNTSTTTTLPAIELDLTANVITPGFAARAAKFSSAAPLPLVAEVPEPGTWQMLLPALAGLLGVRRRRRSRGAGK